MPKQNTQNLVHFLFKQAYVQQSAIQVYVGGLLGYLKLKDPENFEVLKKQLDARLYSACKDTFVSSEFDVEYSDKVVKEFIKGIPDVTITGQEKIESIGLPV